MPYRADQALSKGIFFRLRSPIPGRSRSLDFTFLRRRLHFSRASAALAGSAIPIRPPPLANWTPLIHGHIYMVSLARTRAWFRFFEGECWIHRTSWRISRRIPTVLVRGKLDFEARSLKHLFPRKGEL